MGYFFWTNCPSSCVQHRISCASHGRRFVCTPRINSTITYPCRFMLWLRQTHANAAITAIPPSRAPAHQRGRTLLGRLSGSYGSHRYQVQVFTIRYSDLESCSKEENSETIKRGLTRRELSEGALQRFRCFLQCRAHWCLDS